MLIITDAWRPELGPYDYKQQGEPPLLFPPAFRVHRRILVRHFFNLLIVLQESGQLSITLSLLPSGVILNLHMY